MGKTAFLRCEVGPGMFDNEVAICVKTVEGLVLSFFIPKDFVREHAETPGEASIAVEIVDREGESEVVGLPRRTFEGTNVARVPSGALHFA